MSLLDWFRNAFSGRPHVADAGDEGAETDAALREEFGTPDEGEADLKRLEHGYSGGGPVPGLAGRDSAEVAADELEDLERPSDPAP